MKGLVTLYLRNMLQGAHLHLGFIHIVTSSKLKKQKLCMNLNLQSGLVVIIITFQLTIVNTGGLRSHCNQTDL